MMKVDGKAFKKAREQIRKEHIDDEVPYGEPAIGTQLWLAEKAGVTRRTIQNLENKGVASLGVIDAVSIPLNINGKELILDYGINSVSCEARGVIDFRPNVDMLVYKDGFFERSFMITIDPLIISFKNDDLPTIQLKNISLKMDLDHLSIDFTWIYIVKLLPGEERQWLGIIDEVYEKELFSSEKYDYSVMFKQDESNGCFLSWKDFIDAINKTDRNEIVIEVTLFFRYFERKFRILVSVREMALYIEMAKKKYKSFYKNLGSEYPRFLQPNALTFV